MTVPLQEPNRKPTSKIDIPNTQDYATLMNSGAERSVVQKIAVKMAGAALLVCGTAFEIHAADEATKGEHGHGHSLCARTNVLAVLQNPKATGAVRLDRVGVW